MDLTQVYIGNMTWVPHRYFISYFQWTSDKDIEDLFTPFGRIKSLKFFEDKLNGKSKVLIICFFYNKVRDMPLSNFQTKNLLSKLVKYLMEGSYSFSNFSYIIREVHGRQVVVNFATPDSLKEINKLVQQTKVQGKKPGGPPSNLSAKPKTGPVPALPFSGMNLLPQSILLEH